MKIEYTQSAAGYGAKTDRVHMMKELVIATEDSKKKTVSTLD